MFRYNLRRQGPPVRGQAGLGDAMRGAAGLGVVRQGVAGPGLVRRGKAPPGVPGPAGAGHGYLQRNKKMIKNATAIIEGLSPGLLMHRWSEESETEDKTRAVNKDYGTAREQAERAAYRAPDNTLYVPAQAFHRLLVDAGKPHKQKGSRSSLRYVVPAAVIVIAEVITLVDEDGKSLEGFEIDSRPVVIPSTKGRIMRHRPKVEQWRAEVPLEIDTDILPVTTIHQLLEEGGRRIGIGDYRPEKTGPYGRFRIISWDEKSLCLTAGAPAGDAGRPGGVSGPGFTAGSRRAR